MVEAKAQIFRLDQEIQRVHSGHHKIPVVDQCEALSRAQRLLFKERLEHIEQDKRYRHELLPLEIKEITVKATAQGLITKIPFPPNYYRDMGIRIVVTKRGCKSKEISLTKMDTGDKAKGLDSPFWQSSYAWGQIFGDEGVDGFYIYNGPDLKAEGMIIDYYRTLPDVHCPSKVEPPEKYIDWNGKEHKDDAGWILDELADPGINLAAMILTRGLGDPRDFQLQMNKAAQTEQISKL